MRKEIIISFIILILGLMLSSIILILSLVDFDVTRFRLYDNYISYKGFYIYSDSSEFSSIKNTIDNLNISKNDYPNLGWIIFTDKDYCHGWYKPFLHIIYLSRCYWEGEGTINGYGLYSDKWLEFALAHELGHYKQYFNGMDFSEEGASNYAHKLSGVGEKY